MVETPSLVPLSRWQGVGKKIALDASGEEWLALGTVPLSPVTDPTVDKPASSSIADDPLLVEPPPPKREASARL